MGRSSSSLSQFFENLRKSSYKIENSGNFWKLRDFFYLLFLIRAGYKAALTGGSKNFVQVPVLLHDVKNMGVTPWYERNDSLIINLSTIFILLVLILEVQYALVLITVMPNNDVVIIPT